MSRELLKKVLALPRRIELLGGQNYSYVCLEDVTGIIEAELAKPEPESWLCKMVAADWKEKTATMEFQNNDFKAFAGNYYLSMSNPQLSENPGQLKKPDNTPARKPLSDDEIADKLG
jgi:hypothetical protein